MSSPAESDPDNWIALVDCESFYASAEAVFDPTLRGKPVVVLSNNDGCIVALNRAAKQAGAAMGSPWFQVSAWAKTNGVEARSSNYELYGSLSSRVMEIIGMFSAWQEIYSIDESFIGLRGSIEEVIATGKAIRETVLQWTGVPVRVAVGRTKTQAKLASLGAKADLSLGGVCHLQSYTPDRLERIMGDIPASEIWGVGRRLTKRLAGLNIHTVKDLRDSDLKFMRRKFSVVMTRTIMELRGVPCIPLEDESPRDHADQLIYSRSFSTPVKTPREMRQVLSIYAQKVSGRLREQGLVAENLSAWASTAYYKSGFQTASVSVPLPTPTDDPIHLARASQKLLQRTNGEAQYVRAGVILTGLRAKNSDIPLALFEPEFEGRRIGETLDSITQKLGREIIGVGFGGLKAPPSWAMKRRMLSKRAMTVWAEIPVVKA